MVKDTDNKKIVTNPRGGHGSIELHEIVAPEQMLGHVSLFAKVIINPRSAIGLHRHIGEAEAYYVLKGEGYFLEDDGSRVPVRAGDICTMEVGGQHGMENPHQEAMEIIALVYPDRII